MQIERKLRIILVDDHAMVREQVKSLINSQPDMQVVSELGDGLDAWKIAHDLAADIVVIDIGMPQVDGITATRQIKQHNPNMKVLALSIHEDTSYMYAMLQVGASGYVLKRSAPRMLIQAIRSIAQGAMYFDQLLPNTIADVFNQTKQVGEYIDAALSEHEIAIIRLTAQGYSNQEIAAQLHIDIKIVENDKMYAMEKLGLENRVAIVRYALQQGWL